MCFLASLLVKHAPVKTGILPSRTKSTWYTDELRLLKQERRLCERRWIRTDLQVHREALVEKRRILNALLKKTKSQYYNNLIGEHSQGPKKL
ncbi:hypothetical protein CAPTEDRAFT_96001, partial [Capitella teleta]